jgi:hypothetical protein
MKRTVAHMGTLKYDGTTVEFPDRVLAHIEVVVVQKLRRQEAFFLSWHEASGGGGRTGIWLHPAVLITFHYSSNEPAQIDRAWVEKLAVAASSAAGMFVADHEGRPLPASHDEKLG